MKNFVVSRWATGLVLAGCLLYGAATQAGVLSAMNGRSADFTRLPDLSLEAGFNSGEFESVDYQNIGLRVNYRLSPGIILLGDLNLSEVGNDDAVSFGFGAYYALAGVFENIDAALKGAFHTGDFDGGDLDVLEIDFLFSGLTPISSNGLLWYANIGLHRLDANSDSETELLLGGGLVLPVSSGEAFFGIDLIDDLSIGIGYRYFYN